MPEKVVPVNTNGAGDAFTAGLIYAYCKGLPFQQWAGVGMACAAFAVSHEDTVNPAINEKQVLSFMNRKHL
ncbi:MAG: carbohydrate kinase family protein [Lewinellaceae bacterium]|nr:carbohydrate kinase family protein [Lewinellaceae bacterium]